MGRFKPVFYRDHYGNKQFRFYDTKKNKFTTSTTVMRESNEIKFDSQTNRFRLQGQFIPKESLKQTSKGRGKGGKGRPIEKKPNFARRLVVVDPDGTVQMIRAGADDIETLNKGISSASISLGIVDPDKYETAEQYANLVREQAIFNQNLLTLPKFRKR